MIFVSTALYALARKYGLSFAAEEFTRQVKECVGELVEVPPPETQMMYIPAAWTVARCALLGEVQINVNAGATVIAKARNMAAHAFLESPCDVWVTVDDDVEVSSDALAAMIEQCKAEPSIVVTPCLLRDTRTVNIELPLVAFETTTASGARLQRINGGGFGCVAMSRKALELYAAEKVKRELLDAVSSTSTYWNDMDGVLRSVLFRDEIDGFKWYTEDSAFFRHVPREVGVYAVRVGRTVHNGQILDLATLEALVPA